MNPPGFNNKLSSSFEAQLQMFSPRDSHTVNNPVNSSQNNNRENKKRPRENEETEAEKRRKLIEDDKVKSSH